MARKPLNNAGRAAKNPKKHLIDPRYSSPVWTLVWIVILGVIFYINNSQKEPDHGPYPPFYNKTAQTVPDSAK